ncbi:MAG: 5'-nucleotidase [Pseudomonadota bacterium]|nr:5'-nucleotidase [Pseudomonadota bacterium]
MSVQLTNKLVIAISSRALFDLTESNAIYDSEGVSAFANYQIEHENTVLNPGVAFGLVQKLLSLNKYGPFVEVILLSRNSADSGLRIFNSITHYQLDITRAAFCSGESPYRYVSAFGSHLFLSSNPEDVRAALDNNCAAATILNTCPTTRKNVQLRIAFDGDAVVFSDEAERIYQAEGIVAFAANEVASAHQPLAGGPFKGFLSALHHLQQQLPADECPLRTALVTARSAPAHERVIRTLRSWNIRIDEALFLGGLQKGEFLDAFGADIFFDDQRVHCESASKHVATGHVPSGITNIVP